MNAQPEPAAFALALYEGACESHQRKDWRNACHALAKALKAELLRTSAIQAPAAPAAKAAAKPKAPKGPLAFEMTAESLTKALRIVCRAVERNVHCPILETVLIRASANVLTLVGTDLDREISVNVEAPDVGQWAAVVDGKALSRLLGSAKGPVTMQGEGIKLTLGGALNTVLSGFPFADFPTMKAPDKPQAVKVSPATLADLLGFVQPAISEEETRYYLNGAYLHTVSEDGRMWLRACATDGSRLNVVSAPGPKGLDLAGRIIPRRVVADLLAMLPGADSLQLGLSASHLVCHAGPVSLTAKLIDGSFPDYQRVIPNGGDGPWVEFDAGELSAALAKVSAVSNEKSRSVRFAFTESAVTLTCRNMEGGSASETLACSGAEPKELSFNATYLRQSLATLKAARVRILIGSPNDPARIESADKGADGRLCVVMPLRT